LYACFGKITKTIVAYTSALIVNMNYEQTAQKDKGLLIDILKAIISKTAWHQAFPN